MMAEESLINVEENVSNWKNLSCPEYTNRETFIVAQLTFWVGGVVNCIIAKLGFIINVLSIYALLTNPLLNNMFNMLLSVLLVIDSVCLFFIMVDVVFNIFKLKTELYDILIPYFYHPFRNISLTSSIFMTIAISHERYKAIQHPFIHRQRRISIKFRRLLLFKYTFIVIVCALLINFPKFFEAELEWTCHNKTISHKVTNTSNIEVDTR